MLTCTCARELRKSYTRPYFEYSNILIHQNAFALQPWDTPPLGVPNSIHYNIGRYRRWLFINWLLAATQLQDLAWHSWSFSSPPFTGRNCFNRFLCWCYKWSQVASEMTGGGFLDPGRSFGDIILKCHSDSPFLLGKIPYDFGIFKREYREFWRCDFFSRKVPETW